MLSHNALFEDLIEEFGHSGDTLHHHINHFFDLVVPTLSKQFLKPPNPIHVHPKIERDPMFYPYFKVITWIVLSYVNNCSFPSNVYKITYSFFYAELHWRNRWHSCAYIDIT
jgi:hypothetical protein